MIFVILGTDDHVLGELDLGGSLWRQITGSNKFENINSVDIPITRTGTVRIGQLRTGNEVIEGPIGVAGKIDEGSTVSCRPGSLTVALNERYDWGKLVSKTAPPFDEDALVRQILSEIRPSMSLETIVRTTIRLTREALLLDV